MKFCCFLVFSFLLFISTNLSVALDQTSATTPTELPATTPTELPATTPTEPHATTPTELPATTTTEPPASVPNNPPGCGCIASCEETPLLIGLYGRLSFDTDKIGVTKRLLKEIEGWLNIWEPTEPKKEDQPSQSSDTNEINATLPNTPTDAPPTPTTQSNTTDTTQSIASDTTTTTKEPITTPTKAPAILPNDPLDNSPSPPKETDPPPIATAPGQTVSSANKENTHFYHSTFFFVLILFSIMTVFSVYFGYVSRRKIKVYFNKNWGVGRNAKPYSRVPTLEEAMPSFAEVKS